MAEVGHMSSTAHVGVHAFNVDDPDWASKVVWETATPYLFTRTHTHTQGLMKSS